MTELDEASGEAVAAGILPIDSGVALDNCDSVALLLLQWRTAIPLDSNGVWQPPDQAEIHEKRRVLTELASHLVSRQSKPLFVVAPELSLPAELIPDVERLIKSSIKPIIVMAGLEHLSHISYEELSK